MIHCLIHINLESDLILTQHNQIVQPGDQIMTALELHHRQQTLAIPTATGIELEDGMSLLQQQR